MKHNNPELDKAVRWAGSQAELARRLGVSRQAVNCAANTGCLSRDLAMKARKLNPELDFEALVTKKVA